jgi:cell division protein FtsW (lipid II flippase)
VNEKPRRSLARTTLSNAPRGKVRPSVAAGRQHKPDYWILVLSALLLTIGLVVVYSISPGLAASQHISQNYFIVKQLIAVGLGIVTFLIASYIPLAVWREYR